MAERNRFVRRYTSISAVIDILDRKKLPLLDPEYWDDRNDRYYMALYKKAKRLKGVYALCAAQCPETYHHWRVFTGTADGACIEIKREPLEAVVRKTPGMRCGAIKYLKLDEAEDLDCKDVDRLPFIKRFGFAAEKEYRIIAESDDVQDQVFTIDFHISWINNIYINPWLPKSIAKSVIKMLKTIPGCHGIKISRSLLIESTRWKRAGDRAIEGESPDRINPRKSSVNKRIKSRAKRIIKKSPVKN